MADITSSVQQELNETGAGIFWPVQQVYDAINETLLEFDTIAYFPMGSATMTFGTGSDLVAWPNTSLAWPHYLEFFGRQYWIIKQADLERYDRNWKNTTQDQPRFFVLWTNNISDLTPLQIKLMYSPFGDPLGQQKSLVPILILPVLLLPCLNKPSYIDLPPGSSQLVDLIYQQQR